MFVCILVTTKTPTLNPSKSPTLSPTTAPTSSPTANPTYSPTDAPTLAPTMAPTESPTLNPTQSPTNLPTNVPTFSPTSNPTDSPTNVPTNNPTFSPTNAPTNAPTFSPTANPTLNPTQSPTIAPTLSPTMNPTDSPTDDPTKAPTLSPTQSPTSNPTQSPTDAPTFAPINVPTNSPTLDPTNNPTNIPTLTPTITKICSPKPDEKTQIIICDNTCVYCNINCNTNNGVCKDFQIKSGAKYTTIKCETANACESAHIRIGTEHVSSKYYYRPNYDSFQIICSNDKSCLNMKLDAFGLFLSKNVINFEAKNGDYQGSESQLIVDFANNSGDIELRCGDTGNSCKNVRIKHDKKLTCIGAKCKDVFVSGCMLLYTPYMLHNH